MDDPLPDTDWGAYASRMPLDEEVLKPLGQVMWAAARLHHTMRDALNRIEGSPSDEPFDSTLGGTLRVLQAKADSMGHPGESLAGWCRGPALEARDLRNGVAHAVAFTADDGTQALMGQLRKEEPRQRLTAAKLEHVAGVLVYAAHEMPH